jgi:hypothetical protein
MKFLIALCLFLFTLGAFAQEDLNSMKDQANSYIDEKMSTLQEAKGCINNAKNLDKFKACKYDMKKEMKIQKMEAMEDLKDEKEDSDD